MKVSHVISTCLCLLFLCSCATEHLIHPQLPADVSMNKEAAREGWLIVTLRLESGEELPFIVDTGTPVVLFDKSLEPKLGKRLGSVTLSNFGNEQKGGCYAAPKLYLGSTPLATGSRIYTWDCKRFPSDKGHPIMGILGMDCLRHYCIQLDFEAKDALFRPQSLE